MRLFRIDAVQLSGFHRSRSPIDIVPGRQPKVAICVIWLEDDEEFAPVLRGVSDSVLHTLKFA